jgi:hypothetical protein
MLLVNDPGDWGHVYAPLFGPYIPSLMFVAL